jgi:uncharacterized protein YndB with AHSA1/START domain
MIVKILIVLAIIIAIPLIVAIFTRKNYSVEQQVTINKPRNLVFDYLKYLKNQDNFSVWANMDPNMKKEYRGTDGTVGFISAWESSNKKVGKGEQEIKKITEGEKIDFEIRFMEPFAGKANATLITESVNENQTRVLWHFDSRMKYPMNLMLVFMNMDKMVGNDLATGLSNLKNVLEK